MKTNYKIFVKLLLFVGVTWFMAPCVAEGQNVIYDLDPQESEFSVVRNYKEGIDITYSWYLLNENCFNYIDRNNNAYYKAEIDFGIKINDFRIYDGRVYFCGSQDLDEIVGWFWIDSMFFYGGTIHTIPIPVGTGPHGVDTRVVGDKLKVFKENGDLHLVMVGYGTNVYNNVYQNHSAILDVWSPNHLYWRIEYTMDYDNAQVYDDLAVTGNYVVVTARRTKSSDSLSAEMVYYSKPNSPGYSIFNPRISNYYYASGFITDRTVLYCKPNTLFLLTEMGGDKFATVCDAVIVDGSEAKVVSYYQNPIILPVARYKYDPLVIGGYGEICYNKQKESLYMHRIHSIFLDRFGTPYSSVLVYSIMTPYSSMSIDALESKGDAVLSGTEPGWYSFKKIWQFDEKVMDVCVNNYSVEVEEITVGRNAVVVDQCINESYHSDNEISPTVTFHRMNIICSEIIDE